MEEKSSFMEMIKNEIKDKLDSDCYMLCVKVDDGFNTLSYKGVNADLIDMIRGMIYKFACDANYKYGVPVLAVIDDIFDVEWESAEMSTRD